MPDGKHWRLERPFIYRLGSRYSRTYIKVPRHFITDFATIPKFLWFLPCWAKFNKAPILHDYLYRTKHIMAEKITRKQADDVFLEAILIDFRLHGILGKVMAYLEYTAVRIFGVWR